MDCPHSYIVVQNIIWNVRGVSGFVLTWIEVGFWTWLFLEKLFLE